LADFLAGSDIRVFVFYYLLIYLITYNLGGKWGLAFLLLSITGSLGINLAFPPPGVPAAAKYWNALIRLIVLGLTVQLTSRLIYTLEHEKALNSQLLEKIDEVNQTNKELHNLNYSIAHDVKNPLMIISSFCDILKEAQPQFNINRMMPLIILFLQRKGRMML
jgi:signal transduction histidine kinase